MYRLIIVDDEPSTRSGLAECVDWNQYGIELVGEANDGEHGWELIAAMRPDIVITDVKMPGIDGIALADRIMKSEMPTKIIFVSGYSDTEYLKSAIKIDAADYILKPIDLTELKEVIEKVVNLADQERNRHELMQDMGIKLQQSFPLLREKFWIRLIKGTLQQQQEINKQMAFLDISLPVEGECCTLIIRIDDQDKVFEHTSERDIELTSFATQNICQEIIDANMPGYVFEYNRGEFVAVVSMHNEEDQERLFTMIKEMKKQVGDFLHRFLNISLTIGVGESVHGLTELYRSYHTASVAVDYKLFLGKDKIITIDQLQEGLQLDYRHIAELVEQVESVLKTADRSKISRHLGEIFDYLSLGRKVNLKYGQMVCLEILICATKFLISLDLFRESIEHEEEQLRDALFKLETLQDMRLHVESYLWKVCAYIDEMKTGRSSRLVETIKQMVENRYQTSLTVNEIAREVHLTSTYICLLFKQETGETIIEYLTRVRMEKAKELLKDSRNKLYDICFAIGYTEPGYFSKQFKKYSGLSPSEYREAISSLL